MLLVCSALSVSRRAMAEGGVPLDDSGPSGGSAAAGDLWDFSKPFWIFFAQERLLVPETPGGEALPRAAFAHIRPLGEDDRLFLILAGIGYLGLYHWEREGLELESSLFTMLVPLGSNIYRDGREAETEEIDTSWTDVSFRARVTGGEPEGVRTRAAAEYQLAARRYVRGDETDPAFVVPDDTLVHTFALELALDTRRRGPAMDYAHGLEVALGAVRELRSDWNAWGPPGELYDDPGAGRATTFYGSLETHTALDPDGLVVLHGKLRAAIGYDLDRLTYIRLGGGGFGRQFDRVGAGSTGAANDGELFRSDGVPGHFGGEFMTDEYVQANLELDIPTGATARAHLSAAYASFRDVLDGNRRRDLLGFGIAYTRLFIERRSAMRLDLGYSPRPDGAFSDVADVTLTYVKKF
jgi:hypothetical protein